MKKYALAFALSFTAVLIAAEVAQAQITQTKVVCTNSLGQYRTFTGNCPIGWRFVGIAN
jgi:hypothetical protein